MEAAYAPAVRPRRFLLGSTALLAVGAALTALEVAALGWSLYLLGYAGLVASFAVIALGDGRRSGGAGWVMAATLVTAAVLVLPRLLMVWAIHVENPVVHELSMPYAGSALVTVGAAGAWIAIAVLAVLARRRAGLGTRGAALAVAAVLLLVPFELRLVPQVVWVWGSALLLLAAASAGPAPAAEQRRAAPPA